MRFSSRFSKASGNQEVILDDAPKATRIGFTKGILSEFVGSSGYNMPRSKPLDTNEIHEKFCALIRDEADPWDYDNDSPWAALTSHLKECTWLEFYDFVELLGKLLLDSDDPFSSAQNHLFATYQNSLNTLLEEDSIGWSLDAASELHRQIPKALSQRLSSVGALVADKFGPAREHYQKSLNYLYKYPADEANAVKEMISALEMRSKNHCSWNIYFRRCH